MKNILKKNLIFLSFAFTLFSNNSYSQIVTERISVDAMISSSPFDHGSYADISDNDPYTQWRSAGVNPAFIRFVFEQQELVDSVATFVGQLGAAPYHDMDNWYLEASDNFDDLNSKTGSYKLVIDKGRDTAGAWQSFKLSEPLARKIWQFTIKRTKGDNNVHVPELGLFRKVDVKNLKKKFNFSVEEEATNAIIKVSWSKNVRQMYDGSLITGNNFDPDDSSYEFLVCLSEVRSFRKACAYTRHPCYFRIQSANTFFDLNNRIGTFEESQKIELEPNKLDSIVFESELRKKFIRYCFDRISDSLEVMEVVLYPSDSPEQITGVKKNLIMREGWRWRNTQKNAYHYGINIIPTSQIKWTSSDEAVATVDSNGFIYSHKAGIAEITGQYNEASCITRVTVKANVKQTDKEQLTGRVAIPEPNCVWELPVLIIRLIPTSDGINKDPAYAPELYEADTISIDAAKKRSYEYVHRLKVALEEGTKFRKYKNSSAISSIGIKFVDFINYYAPLGPGLRHRAYGNGELQYAFDYDKLFADLNVKDYVENKGVKQIWMLNSGFCANSWSYNPDVQVPENFRGNFESYMSTPGEYQTCNGINPEPLPIYNKTYTVISIDYSYPDFAPQNLEPFTHQFEVLWQRQNVLQDGSNNFFWDKFVGTIGRCGWTHTPPNTTINYGYFQYIQEDTGRVKPYLCDIEDWKPDNSGEKSLISYHNWVDKEYNWYDGLKEFSGRQEFQWFIYWMESVPGFENNIIYDYQGKHYRMTNWWKFIYDWDKYTSEGIGLWEEVPVDVKNNESPHSGYFINIYPNPASDYIIINNLKPGIKLEIFNEEGLKVNESIPEKYNHFVDLSGYVSGCYWVKNGDYFGKFIICK